MQHPNSFNSLPLSSQTPLSLNLTNNPIYQTSSIPINQSLSFNQNLVPTTLFNPNSLQANVYNNFLMMRMQANLQSQYLNNQIMQLMKLQAETKQLLMESSAAVVKNETPSPQSATPIEKTPQLCDENKSVKAHLKDIIYFITKNYGTLSDEDIKAEKLKYRNLPEIVTVFEALISKYSSTVKTREEMVKYSFRKGLKAMKQKMRNEVPNGTNVDYGLGNNQNKQHFRTLLNEMCEKIEDDADDDEIVQKPKSKNSKLPVKSNNISAEVIADAFSSEEFCQGFCEFLHTLDGIIEFDNNKKIDKFIKFLENVIKKNSFKDIKKYKRIPWLKIWIENTKRVAYELLCNNKNNEEYPTSKLLKKEEYLSSSYEEFSDESFSTKLENHSETL